MDESLTVTYLVWNHKVHYCVHWVPKLSRMNLGHTLTLRIFQIHFSIILPSIHRSFSLGFLTQILYAFLSHPYVLHTPTQLIFLDLIT